MCTFLFQHSDVSLFPCVTYHVSPTNSIWHSALDIPCVTIVFHVLQVWHTIRLTDGKNLSYCTRRTKFTKLFRVGFKQIFDICLPYRHLYLDRLNLNPSYICICLEQLIMILCRWSWFKFQTIFGLLVIYLYFNKKMNVQQR